MGLEWKLGREGLKAGGDRTESQVRNGWSRIKVQGFKNDKKKWRHSSYNFFWATDYLNKVTYPGFPVQVYLRFSY